MTTASPSRARPNARQATKVVVVDPLDPSALATLNERYSLRVELRPSPVRLRALASDAQVVVLRSGVELGAELFQASPHLKVVARAGVGVDNIDLESASAHDVVVFNVPAVSARAVAEHAIGLAFAVSRHTVRGHAGMRAGQWLKAELVGRELTGATIGVVGWGAIGSEITALASGIGARALATARVHSPARIAEAAALNVELVELDELITRSDVLVLAAPLTDHSRGMIGAREIARMKPGVRIVNVGRTDLVDLSALAGALHSGHVAGAAFDVTNPDPRLDAFPDAANLVLTPHLGAMTLDAQERIGQFVVRGIDSALRGLPVENRVA